MDLLVLAGLVIVFGIIFLAMGLSYLSQGMSPLEYGNQWGDMTTDDYYKNPFFKLNSKYWHYRPKGAVILTKAKWEKIEKNIGVKITTALSAGKKLGRKEMIVEIEDEIREQQAKLTPSSPYTVLGVAPQTCMTDIEDRYQHMLKLYDPRGFVDLDKAFIELAEIRIKQIKKAYQLITTGVGSRRSGDI